MTGMEFYFTPKGEVMIIDECGTRQLEQSNREFISEIITRMGIFWPEALEKASLEYTDRRYNIPWFEFSIVRRFLKCNFGEFDSTMDIDQMGNFHFEVLKIFVRLFPTTSCSFPVSERKAVRSKKFANME